MTKVLFVCHGNICRSPMAEYVLRDMAKKRGRDDIVCASCATSTEEIGNPVYPPARRLLAEKGISCDGHAARQATKKDAQDYDYIFCMDEMNVRNLARIFDAKGMEKVQKLMDLVGGGNVADPWYTGDFNATWNDVTRACEKLLEII